MGSVARSEQIGFIVAYRISWLALALVGVWSLIGCGVGDNTKPPLPDGWMPVSYQGIEIYVPQSWPVEELALNNCRSGGTVVLVGPRSPSPSNCPAMRPSPGTIVRFSGPTPGSVGPETKQSINGVSVFVSESGPNNFEGFYTYMLYIRIPDNSVYLDIESMRTTSEPPSTEAQQIMSSIHTV